MDKIGFLLIMLGVAAADSEWLVVPVAMIVAGVLLMRRCEHGGK